MKKIITIFCLLFSLLFLQKATAQQINTRKLDSLFNILTSKNLMMGSVAISKGDKIVYNKSFGYRYIDSSKKVLADENTKYRIGSITKLFTSVMIFQLVQEHKLSLDTKLATFFPQIKNADKITIADMMHHRSGIHDASNDTTYQPELFKAKSETEILNILSKCSSDFEPDTQSAYSNSNFTLLGYIVERLDKDSYEASLKKRIVNKLHLKNTYVDNKISEKDNETLPYYFDFDTAKWILDTAAIRFDEGNITAVGGAGNLVSTPSDLNIFMNALFDKKIISEENLTKDTTIKGDFGMDITKIHFYGKYGWGHGGRLVRYLSSLYEFPKEKITVAGCYNGVNFPENNVLIAILSCCFNRDYDLSQINNPQFINLDTTVLEKYTGTFISNDDASLKIKIFIQNHQLFAQATEQDAMPIYTVSEREFINKENGVNILFDNNNKTFLLRQGDNQMEFIKK